MKLQIILIIVISIVILLILGFVFLIRDDEESGTKEKDNDIVQKFEKIDEDIIIKNGSYHIISLEACSGKKIEYSFNLNESYNDRQYDIYIMEEADLEKYPDGDFGAPFVKINTRDSSGNYSISNWGKWFLVIDNILTEEEREEYKSWGKIPQGDIKVSVYVDIVSD